MKLIAAAALLAGAQSEIMSRSQRNQLKQLIQIDLESDKYDTWDPSVILAFQSYANSDEFKIPADVPKVYADWYKVQTGRVECDDDCDTGVLDLTALHGYGCWCFLGNVDSQLGRGPPIDAYDTICKALSLCYRCVIVDAANEGEDCDPFTVTFNANLQVSGAFGISNVSSSCQTNNVENCSWRTCTCAMTMVTSFFNLSFDSSNVYDDNVVHSNGFDYSLECPQQGKSQDRQCCGFYPNRRTYDRHEARNCCHERTIFNPLRHQCCDDGSHVGLGNRC